MDNTPGRLVAFDPSLSCTGYALFVQGNLKKAGIVQTHAGTPWGKRLWDLMGTLPLKLSVERYDVRVMEWPQVYGLDTAASVLEVAAAGGAIASVYGGEFVRVLPREWKGQVPKTAHNRRVLKVLSETELGYLESVVTATSLRNNMIDAVGLGLWALGRLVGPKTIQEVSR
jgi:hypothetical protein